MVPSGCGAIRRRAGVISTSASGHQGDGAAKTQRQPNALATSAATPGPKSDGRTQAAAKEAKMAGCRGVG